MWTWGLVDLEPSDLGPCGLVALGTCGLEALGTCGLEALGTWGPGDLGPDFSASLSIIVIMPDSFCPGRALFSRSDHRTVAKTSPLMDSDITLGSEGETEVGYVTIDR